MALLFVWLGGWLMAAWVAVAAALMAREWSLLTGGGRLGFAGGALAASAVAAVLATAAGVAPGIGVLALVGAAVVVYGLARTGGVEAAGWVAAGTVVVGLPCGAFVWLRQGPIDGR
ncbi:MAG: phosphatidate cytidylyltransferase, partial [Proteobacteria bacterium]|nr:phosphatidate cytidylyltransferase [Pseudomonadota bacterium]